MIRNVNDNFQISRRINMINPIEAKKMGGIIYKKPSGLGSTKIGNININNQ